jgi:hypothetical protein
MRKGVKRMKKVVEEGVAEEGRERKAGGEVEALMMILMHMVLLVNFITPSSLP